MYNYWAINTAPMFSSFYYTNETNDVYDDNIENHFGFWVGPCIDLKEALPDLWAELSDLTKIQIMSDVLGSHG